MAEKSGASSKLSLKSEGKNTKGRKPKETSSTSQNNSRPNSRNVHRDGASKSTTPKTSREGTPKLITPKSSRGNTPKPSTPKPLPKYQYSKVNIDHQSMWNGTTLHLYFEVNLGYRLENAWFYDIQEKLVQFRKSPLSNKLPECLERYKDM